MLDVAADDDDGADLGDSASEAGERGGQQAVAAVPKQRADLFRRRQLQRPEQLAVLGVEIAQRLAGERGTGVTRIAWAMIMAVGV